MSPTKELNLFNAEAINGFISQCVENAVDEKMKKVRVEKIQINDMPEIEVSDEHPEFKNLMKCIALNLNVALVGPAGSGKTTSAKQVAKLLNRPFYSISVGQQTGKHEFFGYQDAHGNYVRPLFREAYENGGLFLIDKFDAGNANVFTAINQALANGECAFPDGMVNKHKDFVCIIAGNTYGNGADHLYVGRSQIDAATLDRFVFIDWVLDEKLETKLSRGNAKWLEIVRQFRQKAEKNHVATVIGVRAVQFGALMLEAGVSLADTIKFTILKGLSADEIKQITPDGGIPTEFDGYKPPKSEKETKKEGIVVKKGDTWEVTF